MHPGPPTEVRTPTLAGWPPCPTIASGASVFVIDSTGKLFGFDADGNATGSVALPTPIGSLNGGGIALGAGTLFVTIGQPTNAISAYSPALAEQTFPDGSFTPLSVPRGIAYDCHDAILMVGSAAAGGAWLFSTAGARVAVTDGGFAPGYGTSGIAYDPDDGAFWVTNYAGFPTTKWGVSEFMPTGKTMQTFDHVQHFGPPGVHQSPYSIAVCGRAATGSQTLVVVGFIDDGSHDGTPAVQAYTTDGTPSGPPFKGPFLGPYGLSCDSRGRVYIADVSGLQIVELGGAADAAASGAFAGLTPPLYGVLAAE
jgi:DNA-binding beta-propeller fold protein YncE